MSLTCEYTTNGSSGTVTAETYSDLHDKIEAAMYIQSMGYLYTAKVYGSGDNDASELFKGATRCTTIDLSELDTSNVTDFSNMFQNCYVLTSIVGLEDLNTANAVKMEYMFDFCRQYPSFDLSNWNINNMTSFYEIFSYCDSATSITLPSATFTAGSSTTINFKYMFRKCAALTNLDLSMISVTGKTINLAYMFYDCTSLQTINIKGWNPTKASPGTSFVDGCTALTTIYCNYDLGSKCSGLESNAFRYCTNLVGAISYDSSKITFKAYANPTTGYFTYLYELILSYTSNNQSALPDGSQIFSTYAAAKAFKESNKSYFSTITVSGEASDTDASTLLSDCVNCTQITIDEWNTSNVTTFRRLFYNCQKLIKIVGINTLNTSNVTTLEQMLWMCPLFTQGGETLDLTDWNVSNVTNFEYAFATIEVADIDISTWNPTGSTLKFGNMFSGNDTIMTVDLRSFNLSGKTIGMSEMFNNCSNLQIIHMENWNPSTISSAAWCFWQDTNLTTIYCDNDLGTGCSNGSNAFTNCTSLVGAISYDSSKTDFEVYGNPDTGYFTGSYIPLFYNNTHLKQVYFNNVKCDHVYWNGEQIY